MEQFTDPSNTGPATQCTLGGLSHPFNLGITSTHHSHLDAPDTSIFPSLHRLLVYLTPPPVLTAKYSFQMPFLSILFHLVLPKTSLNLRPTARVSHSLVSILQVCPVAKQHPKRQTGFISSPRGPCLNVDLQGLLMQTWD